MQVLAVSVIMVVVRNKGDETVTLGSGAEAQDVGGISRQQPIRCESSVLYARLILATKLLLLTTTIGGKQ